MADEGPISILFGLEADPQTATLAPYFDRCYLFDEYEKSWIDHLDNEGVTIVCDRGSRRIMPTDSIYVRGPDPQTGGSEAATTSLFVLAHLITEVARAIGTQPPILNKLSQLADVGHRAPITEIIHNRTLPEAKVTKWINKPISNLKAIRTGSELNPGELQLNVPTLLQERLQGQELKVNAMWIGGLLRMVAIPKNNPDHPFEVLPHDSLYNGLKAIAERISERFLIKYFDFDVFHPANEAPRFLEWNNSIGAAPFECQLFGLPILSLCAVLRPRIAVIGQAEDRVFACLQDAAAAQAFIFLQLESYGVLPNGWQIYDVNGYNLLRRGNRFERLGAIYIRLAESEELTAFYESLEWLDCVIIGKASSQHRNGSKPLQASTSLAQSLATQPLIKLPRSLIIKARHTTTAMARAHFGKSTIVKSMSGVRSIVVDDREYELWNYEGLRHLPTYFQERIDGFDARVHYAWGATYGIKVRSKEGVDYRYTARSEFLPFDVPEPILGFAAAVSCAEANGLMGLDFLVTEEASYCLEANPSPGWTWYYDGESEIADAICESLLHV